MLGNIGFDSASALLARHGLRLQRVADGAPIPGSFWGDSEAGLIATTVFARADTPVHSLLHEAAHLLVMPEEHRQAVHTDATDSIAEEDAACYLQILLAESLDGVGSERLMADMDAWGYSFRLGSARAWFGHDAEDARAFLKFQTPLLWERLQPRLIRPPLNPSPSPYPLPSCAPAPPRSSLPFPASPS